jgi:hypothetical protein
MVAVACILCASSAGASAAQNKHGSDPARWYKGDSTQAQRMQVLKKELNAAYAEQTAACKKKKSGKQSACLKEARANFQRDSANARRLVANAPQSEITERVVSTTPAGGQDSMQPGASAVGGSGAAGQTGSSAGQTGMGTNPAMTGGQQSGAPQTGAQQSGATGYGSSQSMGASTPPIQSGMQNSAQPGYGSSNAQSGYGSSAAGASQSGAPINGPTQSGSNNSNGSQSGTNATQSMGAGTGATQSDTQDQPRAGEVPPVQR